MSDDAAPAYCAYFCEENIWHLCGHPQVASCERGVLVISNRARQVAVWGQRLCRDPELPIAWDYHVVLVFRAPGPGQPWQIWDLDAAYNQAQPALAWLHGSFRGAQVIPAKFMPRFRLVSAPQYRRHFRSDRRHMRLPDGSERSPHPAWAPICGEPVAGQPDLGHNLDRFVDTEDPSFLGEVYGLEQLRDHLSQTDAGPRA